MPLIIASKTISERDVGYSQIKIIATSTIIFALELQFYQLIYVFKLFFCWCVCRKRYCSVSIASGYFAVNIDIADDIFSEWSHWQNGSKVTKKKLSASHKYLKQPLLKSHFVFVAKFFFARVRDLFCFFFRTTQFETHLSVILDLYLR